jgi:hypothetical protein
LRCALRVLARSPGFAVVAVFVLALGIGANSAVVSIIDAMVFRPLPVWEPERLADVDVPASYPDYLDLSGDEQAFSGVAA